MRSLVMSMIYKILFFPEAKQKLILALETFLPPEMLTNKSTFWNVAHPTRRVNHNISWQPRKQHLIVDMVILEANKNILIISQVLTKIRIGICMLLQLHASKWQVTAPKYALLGGKSAANSSNLSEALNFLLTLNHLPVSAILFSSQFNWVILGLR